MDTGDALSPELRRRLDNVKSLAESAEEGSYFFVEVSFRPLVSVIVVTGSKKEENRDKRNAHLHYVYETIQYSEYVHNSDDSDAIGFKTYRRLVGPTTPRITYDKYQKSFYSICSNINDAIRDNHGIKCYEDGDTENRMSTNVFFLHVCNIMNLIVSKRECKVPQLYIKTNTLNKISTDMCFDDETVFITASNRPMFLEHIDYCYLCYAYICNNSFIPIRSLVDMNSKTFNKSLFFTNNRHYVNHQHGKLQEFNCNNDNLVSKMLYRSF